MHQTPAEALPFEAKNNMLRLPPMLDNKEYEGYYT
jgi:hypothetical protein